MTQVAPERIRVLIVDDSAFMRKALAVMLEADPQIKVVGSAANGEEGVAKVHQLKPDLVTMDVEMPRMDGLTALRQIMASEPVPVMMVSNVTTDGAEATLEALELGAVDFIPKQMSYVSLDIIRVREELLAKIKDIARRKHIIMARIRQRRARGEGDPGRGPSPASPSSADPAAVVQKHRIDVVAIGSSTGGPPALQTLIPQLPRDFSAGIAIAQHMPPMFTRSLAQRLDSLAKLDVREAVDGEPLDPGNVLIAPGGRQMQIRRAGGRAYVSVTDEPADALYKPCVDVLLSSVANAFGANTMGVVLTGMGTNGVVGARRIKSSGGVVIAQDETSCVVYGMPRAVVEARLTDCVAPIENIASEMVRLLS